jgi:hypothetical protein
MRVEDSAFYVDGATGERRRHHTHETVVQRAVKDAGPIPLRRTCSKPGTTSGRSKNCSHRDVSTTMIYSTC